MKKYKVIATMLIMVVLVSACGGTPSSTNGDSNTGNNITANNDVPVDDGTNAVVDKTDSAANVDEEKQEEISFGKDETITIKREAKEIELTVKEVSLKSEVKSKSDNMFASYFPDKEGECYLVIETTIKNIGGDTIGYHFFDEVVAVFDGKYNYTMQPLDVKSSVMSQYWACDPLKTEEVYFVQSVPDEVKTMGCKAEFKVGDSVYVYRN